MKSATHQIVRATIDMCAWLGFATLSALLGAALTLLIVGPSLVFEGISQGVAIGTDLTRTEVMDACQCWFNNCSSHIMACKQLDWMETP